MGGPVGQKVHINVDLAEDTETGPVVPILSSYLLLTMPMLHAVSMLRNDPLVMIGTVHSCKRFNVKVGAHVGLPDLQGFGHRELKLTPSEHTANRIYQIGALQGFLTREDVPIHHVKPHGMLYGMMCRDYEVATALMRGIPAGVAVFGLRGTNMEKAALDLGIPFMAEVYDDVKYNSDRSLLRERRVPRHVTEQIETSSVTAVDGTTVELPIGSHPISLCCHSDDPGCVEVVEEARAVVDAINKKYFS
ncbi:hypothetical protein AbraIFM66951_004881 [Aspergillus brasiliensis]|uniref:Lactam utilization protein lamB n=1 Tax=Aspergillus brasiliensis TaxID=319629 RepID=A0A9W6DTV6_9EURO|nr:hypothetical protein AbraCBS73388_004053 [Aspergillus brasiliensis]GKZ51068.1 hypothetical protein AbraIFM66951_004881 [Aspergillus brasiliensis]